MKLYLSCLVFLLIGPSVQAAEPVRIEIGQNYDRYSNEELRRRVYDLERAVAQLQDQVFRLAGRDRWNQSAPPAAPIPAATPAREWTCTLQSFGTTFTADGRTRAKALSQVLKKCSDNSNAIHCKDSDAKCDNE